MVERVSSPIITRRNSSRFDSDGNLLEPGMLRRYLGMKGEIYSITKDHKNPWSNVSFTIAIVELSTGEMQTFGVMSGEVGLEIGDSVEVVIGKSIRNGWENDNGIIQYDPMVCRSIPDAIKFQKRSK